MPYNDPFSPIPLPSLSIPASLQEICHLLGECFHNKLDCHIYNSYKFLLQAKHEGKKFNRIMPRNNGVQV
jgi:hypothetical protein